MNRTARYSNRRTISACRTYRPPARSASTSRSRRAHVDALGRAPARHHRGDADERHGVEREHPARADARHEEAADGRAHRPGDVHVQAVERRRLGKQRRGRPGRAGSPATRGWRPRCRSPARRSAPGSASGTRRRGTSIRPAPPRPGTSPAGRRAAAAAGPPRPPRRRPAGRAARSAGWRRSAPATPAAGSVSISSHCAPTVCIHVPTFDANCAIHSARKTGK